MRTPDGNVEDVQEMKQAGMAWLALNVGDHAPNKWTLVRSRADAASVVVFPWARLGHPEHGETFDDCLVKLQVLYQACDAWGENCIPNVETEFKTICTPAQLAPELDSRVHGISTVGWLYQDTDYSPITDKPFLLQVFWEDMKFDPSLMEQKQRECVYHAREKGCGNVGVTFQTVRSLASFYAYWKGHVRSYFTGDDIGGGRWAAWAG